MVSWPVPPDFMRFRTYRRCPVMINVKGSQLFVNGPQPKGRPLMKYAIVLPMIYFGAYLCASTLICKAWAAAATSEKLTDALDKTRRQKQVKELRERDRIDRLQLDQQLDQSQRGLDQLRRHTAEPSTSDRRQRVDQSQRNLDQLKNDRLLNDVQKDIQLNRVERESNPLRQQEQIKDYQRQQQIDFLQQQQQKLQLQREIDRLR